MQLPLQRYLILLFACLGAVPLKAQGDVTLRLAYFGETGWHPGFRAGADVVLFDWGTQTQIFSSAGLGAYRHSQNHSAFFLTGDLGINYPVTTWFDVGLLAGGGYSALWPAGTVYEIDDQGQAVAVDRPAQHRFLLNLAAEAAVHGKGPLALYAKPGLWLRMPHNQAFLPVFYLELGLTYRLAPAQP